jgi:hypothetical protein
VQIRDLIVCFHKNRLEFKLLYDYRNAGGQMPPPHDTMQFEALKRRLVSQHEAGVCDAWEQVGKSCGLVDIETVVVGVGCSCC